MIKHVGMLTLVRQASEDDRDAIADGLRGLAEVIPELQGVEIATDLGLVEGNAALAFQLTFEDEAGWRAYTAHPAHKTLIAERIAPVLASKAFLQTHGFTEVDR